MQNIEINTQRLHSFYELYKLIRKDVLITYTGPFDYHVLSTIASNIGIASRTDKMPVKKLFRIFIELAQNISFYSAEKEKGDNDKLFGVGILLLRDSGEFLDFLTGNLIKNEDVEVFRAKSNFINSLDKEALREFKRNQLLLPDSKYGGANIGLIQAALISNQPLQIGVTPVSEVHSFLVIGVKIQK